MEISKKKSINLVLIATLLVSLFLPNIARAYEVIGDSANPSLTIYKYVQEPVDSTGEGTEETDQTPQWKPLPGIEFTLVQTHAYSPETDNWTEVTNGAQLKATTDGTGRIVFTKANGLELGRYSVKETAGPAHVNLNPETFYVDVPMKSEDGNTLDYNVVIYPKNEEIRGAVELLKIDGEQQGKVGLAGVEFELYNANDELLDTLVTDTNGFIRVDGLAYGDYYFKEVAAPEEYVMFGEKKEFSITQSGTITVDGTQTGKVETVEITNYKAPAIEKTVNGSKETHETNRETVFTYNLKIALPKDIQDYKKFVVTDILDNRLSYTGEWTVDGIDASLLDFGQNDQTLTWTVNNLAALGGVNSFTINFNAEIEAGAPVEAIPNTGTIDFTNGSNIDGEKESNPTEVIPTEGSLHIIKQDGRTSFKLAGAEFELRDMDGKVIKSGVTNSSGELAWLGLDYGEYQLVETKAPEGYRILNNPIDITINKEESAVTVTVDNYESGWELPVTGGIGTSLYTLIGLLIMATAVYLYFRRKKAIV